MNILISFYSSVATNIDSIMSKKLKINVHQDTLECDKKIDKGGVTDRLCRRLDALAILMKPNEQLA